MNLLPMYPLKFERKLASSGIGLSGSTSKPGTNKVMTLVWDMQRPILQDGVWKREKLNIELLYFDLKLN